MARKYSKFKLLLWKNMRLAFNDKIGLMLEFLFPMIFVVLLASTRFILGSDITTKNLEFDSQYMSMKESDTIPIKTSEIGYYPKGPCLDDITSRALAIILEESTRDLKIVGYDNKQELERQMGEKGILAALIFADDFANAQDCPKHISFKIRFPSESRFEIFSDYVVHWNTNANLDIYELSSIRNPHAFTDMTPSYFYEGFLAIQHAFSMAFIKKYQKNSPDQDWTWYLQKLPYSPNWDDKLLKKFEAIIPFFLIIGFLYNCTHIVKCVTTEKEKQLKEIMQIMGLPSILHWSAWFFRYLITLFFIVILMVTVLKIPWTKGFGFFHYASWIILIIFMTLYCIALITFCFMIASFFSNANAASALAGMIMFSWFLPFIFVVPMYDDLSASSKYGLCLFFNCGFGFGLKLIMKYERIKRGIQFSNLFDSDPIYDNINVGVIMIFFVILAIIHMLIALYMEQISPGRYGVAQKWYYIFTKKFWQRNARLNTSDTEETNKSYSDPYFENEPKFKKVGLKIRNLRKEFPSKVAINGLSLNLYENEITALLGHNGAGKTTMMSILTGMIQPTNGTAILNGFDIRTNLEGARMSLGFCPQYNILFDSLTVREHLVFYSRIKGLNKTQVEREVEKFLELLKLKAKKNTKSSKLPGGMKRRLSIAAALCGGSKVVLCDEPTSGMDPSARRALWDLLEIEKDGRTILFSTNFMDEADIIGDRIAVMCGGKLKAYGTSFFLKKQCGVGYYLICVKKENCDSREVTKLLRNYIPYVDVENEIGTELTYRLPESYSDKFSLVLEDLEAKSNDLKLEGFGISSPTLEEVFMVMGSDKQHLEAKVTRQSVKQLSITEPLNIHLVGTEYKLVTGKKLLWNQLKAMFLKKYIFSKRNYVLFILKNLFAIFFLIIALLIFNSQPIYETLKPLKLDMSSFKSSITVVESPNQGTDKVFKEYENYLNQLDGNHDVVFTKDEVGKYILELRNEILFQASPAYVIGGSIKDDIVTVLFNGQYYHSLPISLNAMHNALLRTLSGDPDRSIEVINHPFPFTKIVYKSQPEKANFAYEIGVYFPLGMTFASAIYILFQIKERVVRSKFLQYVCGVQKIFFWISAFLIDFTTFLFTIILCIIIMSIYLPGNIDMRSKLGIIFVVLVIYAISSLILMYLAAFLFSEPASGFTKMSIISIFLGSGLHYLFALLHTDLSGSTLDFMNSIFMISPSYFLAQSLHTIMKVTYDKQKCLEKCASLLNLDQCSEAQACKLKQQCCFPNDFGYEKPGIGSYVQYTLIVTILFIFLIFLIEFGAFRTIEQKYAMCCYKQNRNAKLLTASKKDSDVKAERMRVKLMSQREKNDTHLVIDRIAKHYKKLVVVKGVSAIIPKYECFGLLGVNGAGKTTLFKILTGEETMSYGEAYVKGLPLKKNLNKIYNIIGYCPQFDGLLEELTGNETLRIFALIRGVPETQITLISESLAKGFGFYQYMNNRIYTYSGGNKRKLSTALAVIGNPSIIYLDEPTTGMDPGARRQLWNKICEIRDAGRTIILTSHNINECEALCTRLAIMVSGEFQCIGSIQHLKNKFSQGFILKLKVKRRDFGENPVQKQLRRYSIARTTGMYNNTAEEDIDNVIQFITNKFPNSLLMEQHQEFLTFSIPSDSATWSKIFDIMENNKSSMNIEDYSVTQTTLEAVLLNVTQRQLLDVRIGQ